MVPREENRQLNTVGSLTLQRSCLIIAVGVACMASAGNGLTSPYLRGVLQIMGLTALCTVLDSQSRLPKITIAWLFSTLWLAACVWWLYIALHHYGGLPVAITVMALFLLCGGLALYYAAALWVYVYCTHPFSKAQKAMVFAACWTLAELARAQWWTGFPWAAIGYAHVDGVLSYAAPWTGIYGLCFLSALLSSALAQSLSLRQKTLKHWSIWAAVVIACLPAVRDTHTAGPSLSVNLLQANISQDTKFREARLPALQWYQTALFDSTAELTVMPETALPYFKDELPEGYWHSLVEKTVADQKFAIVGIPTQDRQKGYGNSAIGLGGPQEIQYDKHHLVPFGEFTPEVLRWFTRMMSIDFGDFNRGAVDQTPFSWKEHRLAITICYEDLFGEELAVRFNDAQTAPTLFVNLSNIAWFGDTTVVKQHLDIARMRSLEFKRPTVRATNSGGTAIIDAQGRLQQQLKPFTRGMLSGVVHSPYQDITFFAQWAGRWGLKPIWLLCGGWMLLAVMRGRNRSENSESVK